MGTPTSTPIGDWPPLRPPGLLLCRWANDSPRHAPLNAPWCALPPGSLEAQTGRSTGWGCLARTEGRSHCSPCYKQKGARGRWGWGKLEQAAIHLRPPATQVSRTHPASPSCRRLRSSTVCCHLHAGHPAPRHRTTHSKCPTSTRTSRRRRWRTERATRCRCAAAARQSCAPWGQCPRRGTSGGGGESFIFIFILYSVLGGAAGGWSWEVFGCGRAAHAGAELQGRA